MKTCELCNLTEKEKKWLVIETKHWFVYLADVQDYIGRCILVVKRHCCSLSELNITEWTDLKEIIDKLERFYKEILGAELCNWSCLMNNFYKEDTPNPHLHIHVRPRYRKPVVINNRSYTDDEFGHHYGLRKDTKLYEADRLILFQWMKDYLNA